MWDTNIGGATGMNILQSNAVVSESILEQHCGLETGIKQKAEKNTTDNKSNKKKSRLNGHRLKNDR
jgi:hypothetical protein